MQNLKFKIFSDFYQIWFYYLKRLYLKIFFMLYSILSDEEFDNSDEDTIDSVELNPSTVRPTTRRPSRRPSRRPTTRRSTTRGPTTNRRRCGATKERIVTRIVGGRPADKDEWPWMAALLRDGSDQFCGGVLIDDQHVLTASHCVDRSVSASNALPHWSRPVVTN